MWPKLLMQLIELLPHATRLVPIADKYFSSRTASEKANQAALAAMAEGVQADLGQVTKAHAGLYRKLQEQEAQIAEVGEDVRQSKAAMERYGQRLEALEHNVASLKLWIRIGVSVSTVLLIVILGLMLRK
jgi:septal ring factor EnvC (AmiA/AmiB activator)